MQSLLFGTGGLEIFGDSSKRLSLKDYLKKAIIYANAIDCPVLVFGSPKNRIARDTETDYPIAVDFFYELGEFAKDYGVYLCIEPNPQQYGTNFINTLEDANRLVNHVNSPGFQMIVDTGTMLINNDKPKDVLSVLANTKHIHLSMPFLKPLNREISYLTWVKEFIAIISKTGYGGFLSIEMLCTEKEDIGGTLSLIYALADKL